MKMRWFVAVPFVAFLVAGAAGCSSACDALADICAKCKDATTKSSCQDAVTVYRAAPAGGGMTACQGVLDAHTYGSCE